MNSKMLQTCAFLVCLGLGLALSGVFEVQAVTVRVVSESLRGPWAIVASPDNRYFINERNGTVRIFSNSFTELAAIRPVQDLVVAGQGGLLDLAFHPDFLNSRWVYVTFTTNANAMRTRLARFQLFADNSIGNYQILFDGPAGRDAAHFGGRIVFDDKGYVYVSFGERHQKEKAQDNQELHGKVVRLNDDGSVPSDNPFGPSNPVFSLGHRNPQGLDLNPKNKRLYVSEHGPTGYDAPPGGDEINLLGAGANYGWPMVHHQEIRSGMIAPLFEYTPAVAPSGIRFYSGDLFPEWRGSLFVATLAGTKLMRLTFSEDGLTPTGQEFLLQRSFGRLRDVEQGFDGSILVVSDSGKWIQISP